MIKIATIYEKKENETELELLWRICSDKKKENFTWDDIADIMNDLTNKHKSESSWRKKYKSMKKVMNNENILVEQIRLPLIEENEIRKLEKERLKLKTEKIEYNKWLREDARDELILEEICKSIATLPPLEIPEKIDRICNKKSWLLCLSDAHYGVEIDIRDFYNNKLNEYSPEIFEKRMWNLFYEVIEKIKQLNITELEIFELGDGIDGMLRLTSQLMKLRYGVIESSIRYANYLSNWLNELSRYVHIKFQMVMDSNHNQLRLLGTPKNSFPDENLSKVMMCIIKQRLKDNPNITIIENPTGMNYSMLSTYCVVGLHGEKKDLKKNLLEMSHIYGIHIDYTVSGHKHHEAITEIGIDSSVLSVGSIIGIDDYSMSLNTAANSSCSMFEFEQGKGRTAEYVFKLN